MLQPPMPCFWPIQGASCCISSLLHSLQPIPALACSMIMMVHYCCVQSATPTDIYPCFGLLQTVQFDTAAFHLLHCFIAVTQNISLLSWCHCVLHISSTRYKFVFMRNALLNPLTRWPSIQA